MGLPLPKPFGFGAPKPHSFNTVAWLAYAARFIAPQQVFEADQGRTRPEAVFWRVARGGLPERFRALFEGSWKLAAPGHP